MQQSYPVSSYIKNAQPLRLQGIVNATFPMIIFYSFLEIHYMHKILNEVTKIKYKKSSRDTATATRMIARINDN